MHLRSVLRARTTAAVSVIGVVLAGAAVVTAAAPAEAALSQTDYGFATTAFGTRVDAEQLGASSGRTAFSYISCTRLAGRSAHNDIAGASVPGVTVGAVTSDNATYRLPRKHVVGTRGVSTVASAVLGDPSAAHITVKGLRTVALAEHTPKGWRTDTRITWKDLQVVPASGTPLDAAAQQLMDALGQGTQPVIDVLTQQATPIEIPGVGTVDLGWERNRKGAHAASASAYALKVKLYGANGVAGGGDDANVQLGRAWARISDGLPAGVMQGQASGTQVDAASGALHLGRSAVQPLPCEGTRGRVVSTALAALPANPVLAVSGVKSSAYGVQRADGSAVAWTQDKIAEASIGGGKIVITGIVSRSTATQTRAGKVKVSAAGTTIGSIYVDGQGEQAIPDPGQSISVPGVATLSSVVTKGRRGISVVALRVSLLDGSGATIDLASSRVRIKRS